MKKISILLLFFCFAISFAQVPSYVPSNGLVGYWPFSGNANDGTSNGNNGTVNGATLTTDRNGNANSAYSFDGVNDYIQVPHSSSISLTGDITMSAWIKTNGSNGQNYQTIISKRETYWTWEYAMALSYHNSIIHNTKLLAARALAMGNQEQGWSSTPYNINTWEHWVVTISNNQMKIYKNGVLDHTQAFSLVPVNQFCPLLFGKNTLSDSSEQFKGNIDDIGIWNRALTAQEITNIYYQTNNTTCLPDYVPTNGLVGYWPFCGNANDASGNGNNGTVNGATITTDRNGIANSAYIFDGVNDYIQVPVLNSINNASQISISAWINKTTNQIGTYFGHWSSTTQTNVPIGITQSINSNSNFGMGMIGGSETTSNASINLNTWQHITLVYNGANTSGSKLALYINGVFVEYLADSVIPNTSGNISNNSFIGANSGYLNQIYQYFKGKIDDIGVWNRVLTSQEIANLYTSCIPPAAPTGNTTQVFCVIPAPTVASLIATGTAVQWYAATTGGAPLVSTTAIVDGSTYYASQTINGCESTTRLAVTVDFNDPQITASATTVCSGTAVTLSASTTASPITFDTNLPINVQNGLIGYWPFTGNANDTSGNGNNGSVNGATLTTDRFGNANKAYNFNGSNNWIEIPTSNTVNFNSNFTILSWINLNSISNNFNCIASKWENETAPNNENFWFGTYGTDIHFTNSGVGCGSYCQNNMSSNTNISANNWVQICVTFSNGNITYYKNGVAIGTDIITSSITSSNAKIKFGRQNTGTSFNSNYFSGKIDDIGIWNRVLSPAEIAQLYSPSTSYLWSTGATTATINPTPTATTTYWCDVTVNGVTCRKEITITVNPNITPTFTQVTAICSGATLAALPTTSNNGITGTWSPALDNTATTSYTFSPTAGLCATTATMTITVNPNITPTFTQVAPICSGATLAALPTTSNNGITGTWSPALDNTATTTYTFTPTAGQCATTTTMTITVNPNITPAFTQVAAICNGATLAALPTTSTNSITGTWSPALNNSATTTYTFTPTAGQCATTATMTINVITPTPAPTGNATQVFCVTPAPTITNLTATGTAVQWYATATGGSPLASTTALVDGTTYYASQTINGCESTTRLAVTVDFNDPQITASATTICSGTAVTLTASTPATPVANNCTLPTNLQNGLVGYWPFCGNANDVSGNGNNGTVNGATLTTDRFGNVNSAYQFVANSDMVGIPNTSINPQNFTISAWCKLNNPFVYTTFNILEVANIDYTTSGGFGLHMTQNDGIFGSGNYKTYCFAGNSGTIESNILNYAFVSTWNHYIVTKQNGTLSLYINNQLISSGPATGVIDFSNAYLQIGSRQNVNNNPLSSRIIDDIYIYNRALSPTEITQLYYSNQATYLWSTGATTATINPTPTATTTYWCDVTVNGVTCRKEITINVNSTTPAPTGNANQIFCVTPVPTLAQLTATGTGIQWYAEATGGTPLASTTALVDGTTYYASQTVNGCESTTRLAVTVDFNDPQITASATTVCSGTAVNLSITGVSTSGAIGNTQTPNPWPNPSSFDAGIISLGQFGRPTIFSTSFWINPESTQNGISIILDCSHGGSSNWVLQSFGDNNYTWGNLTVSLTPNVWQHVLLTYNNGVKKCYVNGQLTTTTNQTINYSGTPNLNLGNWPEGGRRFNGKIDELYVTYNILETSNFIPQQTITNILPNTMGLWHFDEGSGSTSLNSNNSTNINIGSWYWTSRGQFSTTYLWSTGATTPTINPTPTATTTYWCDVTVNGVTCRKEVTITVNSTTPGPTGTATQVFCVTPAPTVASLTATGTAVQWYAAATGGSPLASTTALVDGTTYYASQTINGCESTTRLAVTVDFNDPQITASATTVCSGTVVNLTASTTAAPSANNSTLPTNLQNGLVGYWPFNGNANDVSGNGNNGTVNGATLTTDRFGNANSAYSFDDNLDYINCGNSPSVNISGSLTLSAWINANGFNTDNGIISKMGAYDLITSANNSIPPLDKIRWLEAGGFLFTNSIQPTSWLHIVATFDLNNQTKKVFINGVLAASQTSNLNAIPISNQNLYLGSHQPLIVPSWSFNGKIDDIAIYNRALSSSEISQLFSPNQITYLWSTGATTATINPTPTATTSYWCDVTVNGVTCRKSVTITVNSTTAPTGAATQTFCATPAPTITNLIASGTGIQWYTAATGGSPLASTTALVDGTTYYASQTVNGCESTTRLAVTVDFNDPQITASATTVCSGTAVTLTAGGVNGSSGSLFTSTKNFTSAWQINWPTTVGNNYVLKVSGTYGIANGRIDADAAFGLANQSPYNQTCSGYQDRWLLVDNCPARPTPDVYNSNHIYYYNIINSDGSVNITYSDSAYGDNSGSLTFELYNNITTYLWSTGATTATINPTPTTTTTYWCDVTVNGVTCRKEVTITVNSTTPAPTGTATQVFCMSPAPTVASLTATGTAVQWYAAATGGSPLASTTALVDGTTYYASQTINGCESTTRLAVTVDFNDPQITASATTVCSGTAVTLTASTTATPSTTTSSLPANLQNGLIGYWPFNSNANDESGNGNNGTVNGATLTTDRFGNTNSAYHFEGVNCCGTPDPVSEIAINNNFININSNFTISCWMKSDNISKFQQCLFNSIGHTGFAVELNNEHVPNKLTFGVGPANAFWDLLYAPGSTSNFQNNTWYPVTFIKTGVTYSMYLNGNLEYSTTVPNSINYNQLVGLRIGSIGSGHENFKGSLDDYMFWNRALNSSEITQITNINSSSIVNYLWSTGATTATINPAPTATTTYWVDVTVSGVTCRKEITITVNPNITPTFTQVAAICSGATLAALPTTSNNGITGTWSPALNNTATTTYTFTPTAGQCATTATMSITVNPNITPTFTQVAQICSGATLAALPTTSNNGITGTWSPALNNTATTTYAFTPTAGLCATTATMTITVNPNITPTFTQVAAICSGATLTALPTTSNNGITGTWTPALNNTATTTYTFTPTAGQCATTATMTITVNPNITPTFTQVAQICSGATLVALPTTSNNGITGTWTPALNNTATTTYTFTPTVGLCATTATMTITVNPNITPTFTQVADICSGATLAALPTTSSNGITGTWAPALNNTATTTYAFTPTAGLCATTATMTITVNPNITPTFTQVAAICSGATLTTLPTTSNNGITGTWTPALNNTATTTYTFTPTAGLCATTATMTITVNPNITPTFTQVAPICSGATLAALPTTSNNGITGTWSPALNNTVTTTYTFTPTAGLCTTTATMTITVNPLPSIPTGNAEQTFCAIDEPTVSDVVMGSTNITWYLSAAGGTPLAMNYPLIDGLILHAASFDPGNLCESSTRFQVTIRVIDPALPVLQEQLQFCKELGATLASIDTNGVVMNWYDSMTGTTPLPSDYLLQDGEVLYGAAFNAATNCESTERLHVEIAIVDTNLNYFNLITIDDNQNNTALKIAGIEDFPNNSIEIYNRYGELVWAGNNYDNSTIVFKGMANVSGVVSKNSYLPSGTYFFILQYPNTCQQTELKGFIHLENKK